MVCTNITRCPSLLKESDKAKCSRPSEQECLWETPATLNDSGGEPYFFNEKRKIWVNAFQIKPEVSQVSVLKSDVSSSQLQVRFEPKTQFLLFVLMGN